MSRPIERGAGAAGTGQAVPASQATHVFDCPVAAGDLTRLNCVLAGSRSPVIESYPPSCLLVKCCPLQEISSGDGVIEDRARVGGGLLCRHKVLRPDDDKSGHAVIGDGCP